VTEDPELHLVWYSDRIFIKPLPPFLLSYAFWECHLAPQDQSLPTASLTPAALGFVRTYGHLIRHESDFRVAKEKHLLPPSVTDFTACTSFIRGFRDITDDQVSARYQFGELRLSRLNIPGLI
ncbi:hypothetical protein K402DRAFT_372981, partial [Aulographum hederae CBS 113979]